MPCRRGRGGVRARDVGKYDGMSDEQQESQKDAAEGKPDDEGQAEQPDPGSSPAAGGGGADDAQGDGGSDEEITKDDLDSGAEGEVGDDALPEDLQPTSDNPLARHPGQTGDEEDMIGAAGDEERAKNPSADMGYGSAGGGSDDSAESGSEDGSGAGSDGGSDSESSDASSEE